MHSYWCNFPAPAVLLIQLGALNTVNGEKTITVMRNGIPTTVTITLGARSDTYGALMSGDVKEGDLVVVSVNPPASE